LGCDEGERVRRRTEEKARGTTLWSRRFASDRRTGRDVTRKFIG